MLTDEEKAIIAKWEAEKEQKRRDLDYQPLTLKARDQADAGFQSRARKEKAA